MELNILENAKNRLRFELKGEGNTFSNVIKQEIWNEKNVEIAGYHTEHSLTSSPVFVVQTEKGDAKTVILSAVEELRKKNKALKEAFKKI